MVKHMEGEMEYDYHEDSRTNGLGLMAWVFGAIACAILLAVVVL